MQKTKETELLTTTNSTFVRKGRQLITTTVTITVEPLFVDYREILKNVSIEEDDDSRTPWSNCDGWEHEATPVDKYREQHEHIPSGTVGHVRGHCWCNSDRDHIVIEITEHTLDGWCGKQAAYYGASKQVHAERRAQIRRDALDQLVSWYRDGWQWWYVKGEFRGEFESLSGIDDYEYAEKEVRYEIADEIADKLEKRGYVITYKRRQRDCFAYKRERFRDRVGRNLGFENGEDYAEWLHIRPKKRRRRILQLCNRD